MLESLNWWAASELRACTGIILLVIALEFVLNLAAVLRGRNID